MAVLGNIPGADPQTLVYLNGAYIRLADAAISVLDRGFIFGDGVYEVVPAYSGKPLCMALHLERLERSLRAVRIEVRTHRDEWESIIHSLLATTGTSDSVVYLQVTRGVAAREHAFPHGVEPTVLAMALPFSPPEEQVRQQGLGVVSWDDIRWLRCDIKSISMLGNVLAKQHAVDMNVDEVVQFRDGVLSEGASCNVWVVKNGVLLGPRRNKLILTGVRYGLIQWFAQQLGIPFELRDIARAEVQDADELLVTSATKEVLPIVLLDGHSVGGGRPGPIYTVFREAYDRLIGNCRASKAGTELPAPDSTSRTAAPCP